MPKISVIVAAYNAEKTLRRCVDSILRQTYRDFELLIINDGSSDSTRIIAEEYANRDGRVHLINKKNGGVSSARNVAIKEAKGDYITFVDSDDYIDDDTYEVCMKYVEEYQADAVIFGYYYEQGKKLIPFNYDKEITVYDSKQVIEKIARGQDISTLMQNKIWKKSLFDGIIFPEGQIYEDADRIYYIVSHGEKFVKLDCAKYHWTQNPNSITHRAFSRKKLDEIKALESMINFFSDDDLELKNVKRVHKLKKYEEIIDTMNVLNLENDILYENIIGDFKKYCDSLRDYNLLDDVDLKYYQNPAFNKRNAIKNERLNRVKAAIKRVILKAE